LTPAAYALAASFAFAGAAMTSLSIVLTWRILPFVAAGLVAPGLARLVYYLGVHTIGVARATALVSVQPLLAVSLAVVFLGERPTSVLVLGALAVVGGGALLSTRVRDERPWRRRYLVFPLLAALGFAVRDVLSRYGFREFHDPIVASAAATLTSVVVMWLFAAFGGAGRQLPGGNAFGLFVLAGICEGVAYLTMWRALALGRVSVVSPLINSQPLFAILLALVFLRDLERVTWRIVIASGLIVAGIALITIAGGSP
jgi:transporter family protein